LLLSHRVMKVLMLVKSDVVHDSRVRRQVRTLVKAGASVTVVGEGGPSGRLLLDGADVFFLHVSKESAATRPRWIKPLRWLLLPEYRAWHERRYRSNARTIALELGPFDFVHAHDFPTLSLGHELARRWGSRLVYDSHEWWRGRARVGRPDALHRKWQAHLERKLAADAEAVITVGSEVAALLSEALERRVVIVRNTTELRCTTAPDYPTAIVYPGRIGPGRDLESVMLAVPDMPVALRLIGKRVSGITVPDNVGVLPEGTASDVDAVIAEGGIVAVPLEAGPVNHDVALPNKLFHAVACGVPVVAADLPALRDIVTRHGIGEVYTPGSSDSFAAAASKVVENYQLYVEAVQAARGELNWEFDSKTLLTVYGLQEVIS